MPREHAAAYAYAGLLLALATLVASGLYLTFHYPPRPAPLTDHGAQVAHRVVATVAVVLALLLVVLERGRRRAGVFALTVLALGTVVSGNGLPWTQLALWAVTADHDFRGVLRAAFDEDALRFVLSTVSRSPSGRTAGCFSPTCSPCRCSSEGSSS